MKRKSKSMGDSIDQIQHQNIQSTDDEIIEASLVLRFREESNMIILTDAAIIKSEQIKGDETQEIF